MKIVTIDMPFGDDCVLKKSGKSSSLIASKMVKLAGSLCDVCACDILCDINSFMDAINRDDRFDKYIFFADVGVASVDANDLELVSDLQYKQVWRLKYDPEKNQQEFVRVNIQFMEV